MQLHAFVSNCMHLYASDTTKGDYDYDFDSEYDSVYGHENGTGFLWFFL